MSYLIASPCSQPEWTRDQALEAFSSLGFRLFEWFSEWTASAFDVSGDGAAGAAELGRWGLRPASGHLPLVKGDDPASRDAARAGLTFAAASGTPLGIIRADRIETYLEALPGTLDEAQRLGVSLAIENHQGSAVESLSDAMAVLEGVDDQRLKAVLEVGHLHRIGTSWRDAVQLFGDRVVLVHVKDLLRGECVPFGTGEVDISGLVECMDSLGYDGGYVIELEGPTRQNVMENLRGAIELFARLGVGL